MALRYFLTDTNTTIVTETTYCTLTTNKKRQKMPYEEKNRIV